MHIKGINQENEEVYLNNTQNRKVHLHRKRGLIHKQNKRYNDKKRAKKIYTKYNIRYLRRC